jgi:hypothetical protein
MKYKKEIYELIVKKGYSYNPITGKILNPKNKIIGHETIYGYIVISPCLDNKYYKMFAHKFAWYYIHNEIPETIDHINRIKNDNRIENLRSVTLSENQWNRNAKGYNWKKSHNKYEVKIKVNNKHIWIGLFDTEIEASEAYLKAKEKYHIINHG